MSAPVVTQRGGAPVDPRTPWRNPDFKKEIAEMRKKILIGAKNFRLLLQNLDGHFAKLKQFGVEINNDEIRFGITSLTTIDATLRFAGTSSQKLGISGDPDGKIELRSFEFTNVADKTNYVISIAKQFFLIKKLPENSIIYVSPLQPSRQFSVFRTIQQIDKPFDSIEVEGASEATLRELMPPVERNTYACKVLQMIFDDFKDNGNPNSQDYPITHSWRNADQPQVIPIPDETIGHVVDYAMRHFQNKESNVLVLSGPAFVIGDMHGNFRDLVKFDNKFGLFNPDLLPQTTFLFLGDYVDRGMHSIELLLTVLSLKVLYPNQVFMLRGNHETREVNGNVMHYDLGSFMSQCAVAFPGAQGPESPDVVRYVSQTVMESVARGNYDFSQFQQYRFFQMWELFNTLFDSLPYAAVLDNSVFCCHGGIPRTVKEPNFLFNFNSQFKRPANNPCGNETANDLLWSDMADQMEEAKLEASGQPFMASDRGGDVNCYGRGAVELFTIATGCTNLIRAHQPQKFGIQIAKNSRVITVFSTNQSMGSASVCLVHDGLIKPILFSDLNTEAEAKQ